MSQLGYTPGHDRPWRPSGNMMHLAFFAAVAGISLLVMYLR